MTAAAAKEQQKTAARPPAPPAAPALRRLWDVLWNQQKMRWRIVLAFACLGAAKLLTVITPVVFGRAVDTVSVPDFSLSVVAWLVLAYGLVRLGQSAFNELREFIFAKVAQRAMRRAGLSVFRHLHSLSVSFHLERQTGGLTHAVNRGVKAIEFLLGFLLFSTAPTALEMLMVCGALWWLFDWRFAAICFVTVFGYALFTFRVTEWRLAFRRRMNESDQRAGARTVDSLMNYETVKLFGAEEREAARFDESLRAYETAAVQNRTSLSALNIGQGLLVMLGMCAIMLLAAEEVSAKRASVGDFVVINTYLLQLFLPLNFLGTVYREIRRNLADMEDMFSLLAERGDVQDVAGAKELSSSGAAAVEFCDVHFWHGPREVLRGVSFSAPPGGTLAIVGPSGAGKSTIARLLFRLHDPQSGAVKIGGKDLRGLTQQSARRAVAIVPQDIVLFNDTIAYNIAYGAPEGKASLDEIKRAARLAKIDAFIESLPEGYETPVGERGLKLSGGEKQRVAIARAMLKPSAVLVFDEATSALDSATEKALQEAMAESAGGRTTVIIAHRLSTVVRADSIVVLENGKVAERGNHRALLEKDGLYARLWRRQSEEAAARQTGGENENEKMENARGG